MYQKVISFTTNTKLKTGPTLPNMECVVILWFADWFKRVITRKGMSDKLLCQLRIYGTTKICYSYIPV